MGVFWNKKRCFVQARWGWDQDAVGVYNMGGQEKGGVVGKTRYLYSSCGDILVQIVSFVG
jgi:hypothetical protein